MSYYHTKFYLNWILALNVTGSGTLRFNFTFCASLENTTQNDSMVGTFSDITIVGPYVQWKWQMDNLTGIQ